MREDQDDSSDWETLGSGGRAQTTAEVEAGRTDAPIPLRARSVGQILDAGIEVFRDRFVALVGVALLLWVPGRLMQPFLGLHVWFDPTSDRVPNLAGFAAGLFISSAYPFFVLSVGTSAIALLVYSHLEGVTLSTGAALRRTLRRIVPIVFMTFLIYMTAAFGCCLMLVPGILVYWKASCALPALVIEDISFSDALSRSFQLTVGGLWRYCAWGTLGYLIYFPFQSLSAFGDDPTLRPIVLDAIPISSTTFDAIMVVVSSIFLSVGTALRATMYTVYYMDCRVRRDGEDLRARLIDLEREKGLQEANS